MKCYQITFYDQHNGAEIASELVNVPDKDAANQWALEFIENEDWICWDVKEVK